MTRNEDIAEMFAKGHTRGGTKHLFIEGNTIYSYGHHFPIARRVGRNTYLFNEDTYSMTTAIHKGRVRRALAGAGAKLRRTTTEAMRRLG